LLVVFFIEDIGLEREDMTGTNENRPRNRRSLGAIAGLALLAGTAVGAGALYVGAVPAGNQAAGACPLDETARAAIDAAARGEVAAMQVTDAPFSAAGLAFEDGEGKATTLQAFEGRTLLVNLWATWCVPCREEMPALDALEKAKGGPDFAVLPINIDMGEEAVPRAFYADENLTALPFLRDETMGVFNDLKRSGVAFGLPVTLLVDETGCVRASMNGPANWASPDAAALIDAATAKPAGA
jgi:thiol-disulfide isomerase/thioredoxin